MTGVANDRNNSLFHHQFKQTQFEIVLPSTMNSVVRSKLITEDVLVLFGDDAVLVTFSAEALVYAAFAHFENRVPLEQMMGFHAQEIV